MQDFECHGTLDLYVENEDADDGTCLCGIDRDKHEWERGFIDGVEEEYNPYPCDCGCSCGNFVGNKEDYCDSCLNRWASESDPWHIGYSTARRRYHEFL